MMSHESEADRERAAARRRAALEAVRSMPAHHFIYQSSAEALAFGAVASPALLAYFSVVGAIDARFPHAALTASTTAWPAPLPPRPATFGSLASAGVRFGVGSTLRAVAWCGAAAAAAAGLREAMQVGPRFEDSSLSNPLFHAAGFGGGLMAGAGVTRDWRHSMGGPARRGIFLVICGLLGVALPVALAKTGPAVRRRLQGFLPAAAPK